MSATTVSATPSSYALAAGGKSVPTWSATPRRSSPESSPVVGNIGALELNTDKVASDAKSKSTSMESNGDIADLSDGTDADGNVAPNSSTAVNSSSSSEVSSTSTNDSNSTDSSANDIPSLI